MADSSLLASIISGNDPLAPQMVPAYVAAQQTNAMLSPEYGMNSGPFGALAKVLAGATGYGQAGLKDAVQNVTDQRNAARPEIARLLASPDAFSALAANPQASPLASAAVLNGATPNSVAEARLHGAQALYNAAQANLANKPLTPTSPMYGGASPTMPGRTAGAAAPMAPAAFPQDYTGRPQAEPDVASIAGMPPAQRIQILARMNPAQRAALAAKLAQMQGGSGGARP